MKKLILALNLPLLAFSLPSGSWLKSCNDASFTKGQLSAKCKDQKGAYIISTLNYNSCAENTNVSNNNGALICDPQPIKPTQLPANQDLPGGSWMLSCRLNNLTFDGKLLITNCKNNTNQFTATALDLSHCPPNPKLRNNNGKLTCDGYSETPIADDGLPQGSWRQKCKLNTVKVELNVLHAECKIWSGDYFPKMLFLDNCAENSKR